MSFILHTESPSTEDIIDGNSHNNISIKISETLMRDDVNIIGINGTLGSGKSTVIKLLEKIFLKEVSNLSILMLNSISKARQKSLDNKNIRRAGTSHPQHS